MSFFPTAPKRPHQITQHGETRIDNYYWMRDRQDPEVLRYLRAESDYLEEVMGHTKPLQDMLYAEMKGRMMETDSSVPEKRGGYFYYTRTEAGQQYPIYCRKKESLDSPEEVLLDQNVLAEGQPFCSIGALTVSPDGTKLAYSLDVEGTEVYTIYIRDLTNSLLYPEAIANTFSSVYFHTGVEWANDNQTIFYLTLDAAQRPDCLWRHQVGRDPSQDTLIFQEKDESYFMFILKTRDDAYILTNHHSTNTIEMRFLSADQPDGELKILSPRYEGVEYYAAHHEGEFFIVTNHQARNFRLVKASVERSAIEHWQEVVPHREDVLLDYVESFKDFIVLYERKNGLRQIRIIATDTPQNVRYVQFPEPAYNVDLEANPQYDTTILRFRYSSLITPHSVIDYHMDTGEWQLIKQDEIPSGYDISKYVSERIYATAPDGSLVPISLVHKKDLIRNGSNPTLLYGYGAYGSVIDADFNSKLLSLLDRGFVFAIGHVRGGSDMGRAWYEEGRLFHKKNSFTDFIACAEHLIQQGFTSREKLAITGGSAGGLLVSACLTMRPDLFRAVIAKVAFVDVVTTMSDPTIPLTALEYDEWGNPENPESYQYMMSYSPYDNIRPVEYPHLLITTGLNDPRVAYWEPAKFAAKLRELKTDDNLLLLHTNYASGHAGASGRYDSLKEVAVDYAFLIDRLCAQVVNPLELQEAAGIIREDLAVVVQES
ncbi:MAG TPA: S9 family peptidase [Anaerolineales bacterium]|nr:S9 family peptidase [Anaerolineales bacterium]